jgi:signal transduction histidine kinase
VLVTKRLTRSLGALTSAADQVARGNFEPELPPSGVDEVGKLTAAFGLMVHQVREMVQRIQESRHLAAVGQFASQLSHEIRNPLTSIKLNLQRLERDVADSRIPAEYADPVGICLREVKRLDRVAGGVLSIARTHPPARTPCSLHDAVQQGLEALKPQLEECGIEVEAKLRASRDKVIGDAEQLKGVFLNLFLNAVDAMPRGGTLEVVSELRGGGGSSNGAIAVRVTDSGPGVPLDMRERIFEPFVSTKEEGSGFGLPLAQQTVEEHDGRLRLEHPAKGRCGAVFMVELPLAALDELS